MSAGMGDNTRVGVTFFADRAAASKREETYTPPALASLIKTVTATEKGRLPWLKLARFGDIRTDKNSLRHDGNVLAVTGVEADYDAGRMTVDEAAEILTKAGVEAVLHTSPSHTEAAPRWRVLCPFSREYPPEKRDQFMGRLNGLFHGVFAAESWGRSQAYYYGSIGHNPAHRAELIDGTPIDEHDELDLIWIGKPNTDAANAGGDRPKPGRATNDRSRSARAFRKGRDLRRAGATLEEMVAALRADDDPDVATWTREKGEAKGQRELRRIWDKAAAKGPVIRITAGELHTVTTAAEDALIASGLPIYQRGDSLVQPIVREVPAARGRMTRAASLGDMNVFSMVDVLCATAEYEKFDGRNGRWVRTNPPSQVAQILLSRQGRWRLPPIRGVITTPTLRPDGTLLAEAGYDAATRLYHAADPTLTLRPSVFNPTRTAAEGALRVLTSLLSGFPFVVRSDGQEVSKAVALSALITPVVRGALPVTPLHVINAHAPGSGKSYLVDVASMISTGRPCPVISVAPDEGETEKRIVGLLLAGFPVVSLDNCNGELGGDLLCQAIERPLIRLRRLGTNDITEIENAVSMFATGNNARVRGDMVRRSLIGELDPQVERPELRTFESDPVAAVQADRGTYVSACLVIVRAYIAAGMPNRLPPVASFDRWSDMVRSALVWLGCADPALSMEAARKDDPELGALTEMIEAWHGAFGDTPTTSRTAIETAQRKVVKADQNGDFPPYASATELVFPDLHAAISAVASLRCTALDPAKLGAWLWAKNGRIVGKQRFKRDGTTQGSARWKLEVTPG